MKTSKLTREQLAEKKQLTVEQLDQIAGGIHRITPGSRRGILLRALKREHKTIGATR